MNVTTQFTLRHFKNDMIYQKPESTQRGASMSTVRVVVVDDSAFSRRTITKMLEGIKDIEVVGFATNGEEGIQKVASLKPDLVTLDLEMPKMDGFTLLRILTTRFSVPVIVISALSGADKVFKALELGALDFIAKPYQHRVD